MVALVIGGLIVLALALAYVLYRVYRAGLLGQARKPAPKPQPEEPAYSLPTSYGEDEIVALVKDPYWLYTYWEITEGKRAWFEACYGRDSWEYSEPLLRVYELAPGSQALQPLLDVPVNDYAHSWYIRLDRPNSRFVIDLGRRLPGGTFVTLVRSNLVATPPDRVSDVIDPAWPPLEGVWKTFHRTGRIRGLPETVSSEELFRSAKAKE